jgi:hypothetical protein
MTTAKLIENRIIRRCLQRPVPLDPPRGSRFWAERVIAVLAATACLAVVGSYFEEVLWAGMAAATLVTLR